MNVPLTYGKLRGLQEIANPHGLFTITALDHRGSLQKALNPADSKSVSYQQMVDFKIELLRALAPHSSAILIDPVFGAAAGLKSGQISALC
jgi:tagatose-1,6-bisphosphate aldolase